MSEKAGDQNKLTSVSPEAWECGNCGHYLGVMAVRAAAPTHPVSGECQEADQVPGLGQELDPPPPHSEPTVPKNKTPLGVRKVSRKLVANSKRKRSLSSGFSRVRSPEASVAESLKPSRYTRKYSGPS